MHTYCRALKFKSMLHSSRLHSGLLRLVVSMNTPHSSYAEKIDSIFAIIKSYEQEPQKQADAERESGKDVVDNNASADADAEKSGSVNDKSMSPEISYAAEVAQQIQQQVKGMRLQIESAHIQIELLHGLRLSEESNHAAAMHSKRLQWKQNFKDANVKHSHATAEQAKLNDDLAKQHKALKKEEASLKLSLERIISLERDACKKMQEDGAKELEKAKSSWQYSEKNEFRKREQKLIPKIKREAAKMVESKLRQLREKHNDEKLRLEREAARELQSYKLELYRNSHKICKNERRNVEAAEKRLMDNVIYEHDQKIEEVRSEHHNEMAELKLAHEETMDSLRAKYEVDKKRRLEQHEMDLREAKTLMEASLAQQSLSNDVELKALETKCDEEVSIRRRKVQK